MASMFIHFGRLGQLEEEISNELPHRKQRGIKRKIIIAPRGGELDPRPPKAD